VSGKTLVSAILFAINPTCTVLRVHAALRVRHWHITSFVWHSRYHLKCDVMNLSCVLVTQHEYKCLKTT